MYFFIIPRMFSKDKGADQLRSCLETDLRLCFAYSKTGLSYDAAHACIHNV